MLIRSIKFQFVEILRQKQKKKYNRIKTNSIKTTLSISHIDTRIHVSNPTTHTQKLRLFSCIHTYLHTCIIYSVLDLDQLKSQNEKNKN